MLPLSFRLSQYGQINLIIKFVVMRGKLVGILMLLTATIYGQDFTWDGGAGTNNWADAANWNPDGNPGAGHYVLIDAAATVNLSGTVIVNRMRINDAGATMTVASGASLTVDGADSDGLRIDAGIFTNNGTVMVQNIGTGSNHNCIDLRSTFNNNGIVVTNGSTDDGVVAYDGAVFNNNAGASLTINGAGDFGFYISGGASSTVHNNGTIIINSPADDAIRLEVGVLNNNAMGIIDINTPADLGISILDAGVLNNSGTIDVSGAVLRYGIETYQSGADLSNLVGGIINISDSNLDGLFLGADTRSFNAGTFNIHNSGADDIHAEAGSYMNNSTNSVFAPGILGPGTLSVEGDIYFGQTTHKIEINGPTAGTEHDQINVSGEMNIVNSILEVEWGFTPVEGQSFTILTYGSRLGDYQFLTIPDAGGISWVIEIMENEARIIQDPCVTWDGGGTDNNWDTAENWSNDKVPEAGNYVKIGSGEAVVMPAGVVAVGTSLNLSGSLTIDDMASLTIKGASNIGSGFSIETTGSLINNGSVLIGNSASVRGSGISTSGLITNDGIIEVVNTVTGILIIGVGQLSNNGTIDIDDTSQNGLSSFGLLTNNGIIEIDDTSLNGISVRGGNGHIDNNSTIKIGSNSGIGTVGVSCGRNGSISNLSSGSIEINRCTFTGIVINTRGTTFENLGQIKIGNIAAVNAGIDAQGGTTNAGTILFDDITNDGLTDGSTLINASTGTIDVPTGGKLKINATALLTNKGTIKGSGTVEPVGTVATFVSDDIPFVAPGTSPGKLTITGDYNLGTTTYNCEINGPTTDTEYDVLAISGTATLTNANLVVDWGTFTPLAGQSFTILTCGSRVDEFSSVTIPAIAGLDFTTTYTATNVVISVAVMPPPGAALHFDGTNDGVNIGNQLAENNNQGTMEAWIYYEGQDGTVIGTGHPTTAGTDLFFGIRTAQVYIYHRHVNHLVQGTTTLVSGNWYHIVVTSDGSTWKLYLNGVEESTSVVLGANSGQWLGTIHASANNTIGYILRGGNPSSYYKGIIDEVKIWDFPLCVELIQGQMDCELDLPRPGLLAYYQFNEGLADADNSTVTTVPDLSGNSYDGTLNNFALAGSSSNWTSPGGVTTDMTCLPLPLPDIEILGGSPLTEIVSKATSTSGTDDTDFGFVEAGNMVDHTFTIRNTGLATLDLTGAPIVSVSGDSEFTVLTQPTSSSIAMSGADLTFVVRYAPTVQATHTAIISIENNDCDEDPYTFTVIGNNCLFVGSPTVDVCTSFSNTVTAGGGWTPINDASNKIIASINAPSGVDLGTVTVQVKRSSSTDTHISGDGNTYKILPRYFQISSSNFATASNFPSSVGIRLYFTAAELDTMNNADMGTNGITTHVASVMNITHYFGANQNCEINDNTMTAAYVELLSPSAGTVGCLNENHYLETSVGHFSEFAIHEPAAQALLPVELMNLQAVLLDNKTTQLTWQTASEVNNEGFDIERSKDGQHWEIIGFVDGHGTTQVTQRYTIIDEKPMKGLNYYRLRQVDFDGKSVYSFIVSIDRKTSKQADIKIYPNPVKEGDVTIIVPFDVNENSRLHVYSVTGQLVRIESISATNTAMDINGLVSGVYLLEVTHGSDIWRERLIIQ